MSNEINIFGRKYTTAAELIARLGELTVANTLLGESDDRVTEINLIVEEIVKLNEGDKVAAQLFARNARVSVSFTANQVLSISDESGIATQNVKRDNRRIDWHNVK